MFYFGRKIYVVLDDLEVIKAINGTKSWLMERFVKEIIEFLNSSASVNFSFYF